MLAKLSLKQPYTQLVVKHGILPFFFYFFAFCILTYPLILKFSTHFFADAGDGLQNVWNFWWVNSAVLQPQVYPTMWHTDLLHWPFGITLRSQTLSLFNTFSAIVLMRVFSMTVTYNILTIFAFVGSGLTMYWLAYYITKSFWGSILAGFIFTFSGYHFAHAEGHLNLISMQWMPLFILCWYLVITKPNVMIALGTALVLWIVMLCDYYYFFYCILTAIIIVLWYAIINRKPWFFGSKDHMISLSVFAAITLLLTGPSVGSLWLSNFRDPLLNFHDPYLFSLDLLALVIPGGHWLFNPWTEFYWSKLPGNIHESSVHISLSVFILLGYVWVKRKTLEPFLREHAYLWFGTILFFFLIALGPALQIAGNIVWENMPYDFFIIALPFLKLSGVPIRMVVMVLFGASLICAIALRELLQKLPSNRIFIVLLMFILVFETLPKPIPTTRIDPPEYVIALDALPDDGGVLDLVTEEGTVPLYYQTFHGKPIVFGTVSRLPTSVFVQEFPLNDTIKERNYGKLWATYRIRYIVTDELIENPKKPSYIFVDKVYDNNEVRIYRIGCICEIEN